MTPINPNKDYYITAAEFYEKGRRDLAYAAPEEMCDKARVLFSKTYQKAREEGDAKMMIVASDSLRGLRNCFKDYSVHKK